MTRQARAFLVRVVRVVSLVFFSLVGTTMLVRFSPGYFSDTRELDAGHASLVREQLEYQQQREYSAAAMVWDEVHAMSHGDLGRSRHFDVPVASLLRQRVHVTAKLLALSVVCGWLGALTLALPLSILRTRAGEALLAAPVAILLATPVAALATVCLLANCGGPVLILSLIVGARDYQLVRGLVRHALRAPYFLSVRAQGLTNGRLMAAHLLPAVAPELRSLAATSFVLALSAVVPIEVIFDRPGLGQLAWNAAMNRDLPVLLAVTLVMAVCVGLAGLFVGAPPSAKEALCA